jgi:hypothetical protein
MKTLEQAVDNLSETIKEASEMIISLREENKKQKVALDYVKQWLNENIDEGSRDSNKHGTDRPDGIKYDSSQSSSKFKRTFGRIGVTTLTISLCTEKCIMNS